MIREVKCVKKYIYTNQPLQNVSIKLYVSSFYNLKACERFFQNFIFVLKLYTCDIRVSIFAFTQHNTNIYHSSFSMYQTTEYCFAYFAYNFHNSIVSLSIIAQFLLFFPDFSLPTNKANFLVVTLTCNPNQQPLPQNLPLFNSGHVREYV